MPLFCYVYIVESRFGLTPLVFFPQRICKIESSPCESEIFKDMGQVIGSPYRIRGVDHGRKVIGKSEDEHQDSKHDGALLGVYSECDGDSGQDQTEASEIHDQLPAKGYEKCEAAGHGHVTEPESQHHKGKKQPAYKTNYFHVKGLMNRCKLSFYLLSPASPVGILSGACQYNVSVAGWDSGP
jgi:hypothetical protein